MSSIHGYVVQCMCCGKFHNAKEQCPEASSQPKTKCPKCNSTRPYNLYPGHTELYECPICGRLERRKSSGRL